MGGGGGWDGRLGGGVQVGQFGVVRGGGMGGGGGHRLPLPPLALPLTIPSPEPRRHPPVAVAFIQHLIKFIQSGFNI